METCYNGCTDETSSIYIALPVVTTDYTALSHLIATLKDFILTVNVNL